MSTTASNEAPPVRAKLFQHQLEAVRFVLAMFGLPLGGDDDDKDAQHAMREGDREEAERR